MPSLPCPECLRELMPQDLRAENEFLVCAHCGRKVYERLETEIKLICPKCGAATDSDSFHRVPRAGAS